MGSARQPNNPYTNIITIVTDGPNEISIQTRSEDQSQHFKIKVPKVEKVVKTTGSGDTFTGAFISMLLQGCPDT